ncbi:hypothetical protein Q8F55_004354 [Vanrija albida]|uniref:ATP-dependent DNA ligase family profile domain-containing protein n=1 Tax=Vanrija albida TaxID=181172 RepID=A0ABR3Q6S4_9TREE
MPPKRPAAPSTPSKAKKAKPAQTSIASFFSPPGKAKAIAADRAKREPSVVTLTDSDDEVVPIEAVLTSNHIESDEMLARKLAAEWASDTPQPNGKDKAAKDEVVAVEKKPVAALFVKREPKPQSKPNPDSKPNAEAGPSRPTKISSTRAEPVEPIDFDTDSLLFRPDEVDVSKWPGGRLPYSILVGAYVQVSSTRSRLLIDLLAALYLLSNHLRPAYVPFELGVGFMVLSKAIKEVSGLQPRDLKRLWEKHGDPGDVAYEAKSNLRTLVAPAPLSVRDVYDRVTGLARIKGQQSGKLKGDVVRRLMVQARGEEVRFLVRTLIGNLRIGAVRLTLLTAFARAAALHEMPREDFEEILPVVEKGKKRPDPVREKIEARCTEAVRLVRRVYVRHPNYDDLVRGIQPGLEGLEQRVPVSVGVPLSPMLGSITRSIDEVYTRLGSLPFAAEAKLDGQRLQMHVRADGPQGNDDGGRWVEGDGGRVWVRLFSRHLEDMTEKYPDVCALGLALLSRPLPPTRPGFPSWSSSPTPTVQELLNAGTVTSLILDAEIVAVDKDTGQHRTFQELTNRAKKDVRIEDIKVVVEVYAFDLMLLNDVPLLSAPFSHRRHLLRTLIEPFADKSNPMLARFAHIANVDSVDMRSPADLRTFFDEVVEQKAEGLMVKLLESGEQVVTEVIDVEVEDEEGDAEGEAVEAGRKKPLPATYEPDQRSMGWLKVKKDYLEGMGDSLDLVPIGAWWGLGRKAGWWSPILLAARNPESGALEAVCKCISGFSDAFYKALLVRYPPEGSPDVCSKGSPLGYVETGGLVPDVWFAPSEVWEIRGADITLSPVYPAAATFIGGERGLSIRFPRFIRVRDDKGVDEATTSEEFADMYRRQMARPGTVPAKRAAGEEEDGEDVMEDELDVGGFEAEA